MNKQDLMASYVRHLKNEAEKAARSGNIKTVSALNRVAKEQGFTKWAQLVKRAGRDHEKTGPSPRKPRKILVDLPQQSGKRTTA